MNILRIIDTYKTHVYLCSAHTDCGNKKKRKGNERKNGGHKIEIEKETLPPI